MSQQVEPGQSPAPRAVRTGEKLVSNPALAHDRILIVVSGPRSRGSRKKIAKFAQTNYWRREFPCMTRHLAKRHSKAR